MSIYLLALAVFDQPMDPKLRLHTLTYDHECQIKYSDSCCVGTTNSMPTSLLALVQTLLMCSDQERLSLIAKPRYLKLVKKT